MPSQKRAPTTPAPRDVHEWKVTDSALAVALWGRANRLRNELTVASSRDVALEAATRYLLNMARLKPTAATMTVAVRFLVTVTTPRLAEEATVRLGQIVDGQ